MMINFTPIVIAIALGGLILANSAFGKTCTQQVRDHRSGKTITMQVDCAPEKPITPTRTYRSKPSSESAKPPRQKNIVVTAPPKNSKSHLKMIALENRASLPNKIATVRRDTGRGIYKTTTIIIADEIDLGKNTYSTLDRSSPRNIIIVANKLTLNDKVEFDLSGRNYDHKSQFGLDLNDRSGGDLLILTNELICGDNGKLEFRSNGGASNPKTIVRDKRAGAIKKTGQYRVEESGRKGKLIIAANQLKIGNKLVEDEHQWTDNCLVPTVGEATYFYESMKNAITAIEQENAAPHGYAKSLWAGHLPITLWARHAVSKWVLKMLDDATLDMSRMTLSDSRIDAVRQLKKITALISEQPPMLNTDNILLQERIDKLLPLRAQYGDVVWFENISIDVPGSIPRQLMIFTNGDDLLTRVAPTELLVRPRLFSDQKMLGQIRFDDQDANRIHLEFEFSLSIDPLVASLLNEALTAKGEVFKGGFNDWVLTPRQIESKGIIASKVDLEPNNQGGRISLTIDAGSLGLILAQLSARTGIPLVFDWQFQKDTRISGMWSGVNLSLLRRTSSPLVINPDGTVTNYGNVKLSIEYVKITSDRFKSFVTSIMVPSGETVSLPADLGTSFQIPPQAVSFDGLDPYTVRSKFQIINGGEWVDKVTVTNLLGYDENRGGQLRFVEFKLRYKTLKGEMVSAITKLSPTGAQGDETTISFLHEPLSDRQIILSGTAFYEGGSFQTLTEKVFTDLSIKISSDLLPNKD